jgi:hypothetical protein
LRRGIPKYWREARHPKILVRAEKKENIAMESVVNIEMNGRSGVTANATVIRGPQSWAYIYVAFGFALAIESTIISMITPLQFPSNLIVYAVLAAFTGRLFLVSGWFHDTLLGMKHSYEGKAR